ncbi:hypothetical protein WNY78_08860 [Psychroserpens sp. AS72]
MSFTFLKKAISSEMAFLFLIVFFFGNVPHLSFRMRNEEESH